MCPLDSLTDRCALMSCVCVETRNGRFCLLVSLKNTSHSPWHAGWNLFTSITISCSRNVWNWQRLGTKLFREQQIAAASEKKKKKICRESERICVHARHLRRHWLSVSCLSRANPSRIQKRSEGEKWRREDGEIIPFPSSLKSRVRGEKESVIFLFAHKVNFSRSNSFFYFGF